MNLQRKLIDELEKTGVKVQNSVGRLVGDLAAGFIEELQEISHHLDSGHLKQALSWAVDLVRPYLQSLRLRVSLINRNDIEVILPLQTSLKTVQEVDEGAVVSASLFAYRRLWDQNPEVLQVRIKEVAMEKLVPSFDTTLYLRWNMSPLQRESFYAQVRAEDEVPHGGDQQMSQKSKAQQEAIIQVFNEMEQLVGRVSIKAFLEPKSTQSLPMQASSLTKSGRTSSLLKKGSAKSRVRGEK